MFSINNTRKSHIKNEDIKSNIYNYILLRVNYRGMLAIEPFIASIQDSLFGCGYVIKEEFLNQDDLINLGYEEEYNRYIGKEKIYKFTGSNNQLILITRFFTCIYLDYTVAHSLTNHIILMQKIIQLIKNDKIPESKFVIIESVNLIKDNSLVVSSMNGIHKCFDYRTLNNSALEINRLNGKVSTNLIISKSECSFIWNDILFTQKTNIYSGEIRINDKDKKCYEVSMNISGTFEVDGETDIDNIKKIFISINSGIYEIFKMNLSVSFLGDMQKAITDKILGELNKNE